MKYFLSALIVLMSVLTFGSGGKPLFNNEEGEVYFVPQFSEFKEVSASDMRYLKKVLKDAEKNKVKAVIFELDTPGGSVHVALQYLSIFAKSPVKVVAYLNPQGISAGMMVALAADRIVINPSGVIGDAMPLEVGPGGSRPITGPKPEKAGKNEKSGKPEKSEKPEKPEEENKSVRKSPAPGSIEKLTEEIRKLRSENSGDSRSAEEKRLADQKFLTVFYKVLEVLAEKNNRPVRVIRATADPYCELTLEADKIKHDSGSPLTLSAKEAARLGVVDFITADRNEIPALIGLGNAKLTVVRPTPVEQIFHFLASPGVAGLLIVLGLVGLFVEVKTPGFGVPGTVGILAMVLFFWGQAASGASEWGPMVIFFVGIVLLLLEIFVIPGFGLVGILGLLCIGGSFFAAFGFENFEYAARVVGIALLATIAVITLLVWYVLPSSSFFDHIKLSATSGAVEKRALDEVADPVVGAVGVAVTPLRPGGIVEIGGARFEASARGDFIERGSSVSVVGRTSFNLIVETQNKEG